jgi:ADP-ribose pyrophosphatase YjhB (NUDIX family)
MAHWTRRVEPIVRPGVQAWARFRRGLTLGVRGVATDADGRVLLIEHTYVPGWHLPGGGVERGETAEQSLGRELIEEAGVEAIERPRLLSVHDNSASFPGDQVLLYRVGAWRPATATSRGEILEVGFFALDALPDGVTRGTRRRLAEVFEGAAPDPHW